MKSRMPMPKTLLKGPGQVGLVHLEFIADHGKTEIAVRVVFYDVIAHRFDFDLPCLFTADALFRDVSEQLLDELVDGLIRVQGPEAQVLNL